MSQLIKLSTTREWSCAGLTVKDRSNPPECKPDQHPDDVELFYVPQDFVTRRQLFQFAELLCRVYNDTLTAEAVQEGDSSIRVIRCT